jgi:hypothetical protein
VPHASEPWNKENCSHRDVDDRYMCSTREVVRKEKHARLIYTTNEGMGVTKKLVVAVLVAGR